MILPKARGQGLLAIKLIQLRSPMLILISCFILFVTALALIILRVAQPNARYTWLVAVGGAILALVTVIIWLAQMPFDLTLPAWQPASLFPSPILFRADDISWPIALCITTLTLSTILTAVVRAVFFNTITWVGTLALGGLGILAVTADNPLTLMLFWAALDITELVSQLASVNGAVNSEKVVASFSWRALGIGLLLWASIVSSAHGSVFDFEGMSADSGLYLVGAVGLRLGGVPAHLTYSSESTLRRGFGTSLRLISAASSLTLLGRIPPEAINSVATPFLLLLAIFAAIYGAWMWLRAPDELDGRPYWITSLASLSMIATLSGNPLGAVAWACALILVGGTLFLSSLQHPWLNRVILLGGLSLSSLPFSLTAGAWLGTLGFFIPFVIAAQALVLAGLIRHIMRPTRRDSLDAQPVWTHAVYPAGIILLIAIQFVLGFVGWDGALQIGAWMQAIIVSLLSLGLVWAAPRLRMFNPIRAHWLSSTAPRSNGIYQGFWSFYLILGRIGQAITRTLEGEGAIMWTLLFLALFVSLLTKGTP